MKVTMEEVNRWYKENKDRLDKIFQESYPESTIGQYKAYMRKAYIESTGNQIEGVEAMKYKEKVGYEFRGYKLGYTITVDGIETTIIGMTPDAECGVLLAVDPVRLKNKGDWIEELVDAHISTSLRSPVYYLDVEYDGFIWVMSNDSKVSKGRRYTIDHVIELSDIIKDLRGRISNIEKDIKSLAEVKIDKPQDHKCNVKVGFPIKLISKYSIFALLKMAHKQLRIEQEALADFENQLKAMLKEE